MQQDMIGQNIIITEPSSSLRELGRNALKGQWKPAIIALIVYEACLLVPQAILNTLFGTNSSNVYDNNYYLYYEYDINGDISTYNSVLQQSSLSSIYELLVSGAFTLGITLFFLAVFRKHIVGVTDVFLGFERFGKALGLFLFRTLFTFLWSLLFIVPGIIAAIRYSQAFFILADDPNKGIRECMDESKRMMKGNKAKYFCLTLSFIGWALLAGMVAGVIVCITYIDMPELIRQLIVVVATFAVMPLSAYMYSTYAGFYEILAGHLIKETEPKPIAPDAVPMPFDSYNSGTETERPVEHTETVVPKEAAGATAPAGTSASAIPSASAETMAQAGSAIPAADTVPSEVTTAGGTAAENTVSPIPEEVGPAESYNDIPKEAVTPAGNAAPRADVNVSEILGETVSAEKAGSGTEPVSEEAAANVESLPEMEDDDSMIPKQID